MDTTRVPAPAPLRFLADRTDVDAAIAESLDAAARHRQQAAELYYDLDLADMDEVGRAAAWRKMCEPSWSVYEYHVLAATAAMDRARAIGRAFIAYNAYACLGDFKPCHKRFQTLAVKLCDGAATLSAGIAEAGCGGTYLDAFLVRRDGVEVALMDRNLHIAKLELPVDGLVVGELSRVHSLDDVIAAAREVSRAEASVAASLVAAAGTAALASGAAAVLDRGRDRWARDPVSGALGVLARARQAVS